MSKPVLGRIVVEADRIAWGIIKRDAAQFDRDEHAYRITKWTIIAIVSVALLIILRKVLFG